MARNKSPRKRKPVKSGRLPVTSRATAPVYPETFYALSHPKMMMTDRLNFFMTP
ncbi:hypothetical protein QE197_24275 (plasmid) [Arsenophonus nasoniae]|uniref:hypothetical protein n=1 Tax=Arsenophonus nasoniae TaxID=638 RepID=UPI0024692879|nr:hypothetical protein [Arsenophonus nasoniae]WGM13629.1 hypothetical protein QE197_24275 [Arsenophonus nasoniae]